MRAISRGAESMKAGIGPVCTAIVAKDEGPQHDRDVRFTQSEVENGEGGGAGVSRAAGWSLDMFRSPWDSLRVWAGLVVVMACKGGDQVLSPRREVSTAC